MTTSPDALPQAVEVLCPDCGDVTLHAVLHGRLGTRGGLTLDATVRCDRCGRVHHAIVREPAEIEVPVVVSAGATSRRARVSLPADDVILAGDELLVEGRPVLVTGLETRDYKRVEKLAAGDIRTLWAKDFETVRVRATVNLGKKTIAKELYADPDREFTVGQEIVFGRLRVTIHGIKTHDRMLRRGTAAARDVRRLFGKPTRGETLETPPPESEEALAAQRLAYEEGTATGPEEADDAWPEDLDEDDFDEEDDAQ